MIDSKIELNKIAELSKAAQKIGDTVTVRTVAQAFARHASPTMQRLLEEVAPEGSRWEEGGEQRPSIRLGYGKLEDNWNPPELRDEPDGVVTIFSSRAKHMGILLEGSPKHPEPKYVDGPMYFFWHKKSQFVRMNFVNHPGFPASDFPAEAFEPAGREAYLDGMRQEVPAIFAPLREFFSE